MCIIYIMKLEFETTNSRTPPTLTNDHIKYMMIKYYTFVNSVFNSCKCQHWQMFPTRLRVCPVKTQFSLRLRSLIRIFTEHSLGMQGSKVSSGGQRRLIAGRIYNLIGNVVSPVQIVLTTNCSLSISSLWASASSSVGSSSILRSFTWSSSSRE